MLDAPFHFFGDATTVDRVPLEHCVGPAALVRVAGDVIEPGQLRPSEGLVRSALNVPPGKIIATSDGGTTWRDIAVPPP